MLFVCALFKIVEEMYHRNFKSQKIHIILLDLKHFNLIREL